MSAQIIPLPKKNFYFTFGSDYTLYGHYIKIPATTYEAAITIMNACYGNVWGFSYPDEKVFMEQVKKYGYKEVPLGTPNFNKHSTQKPSRH